ncbi:cholinesterase-like [Saccoglossus kowalevskii]|uniref:Carboxylic ester hydrolase n=1 Tax=Saccoglossus kowalevskii TaxID=10224 RepID=A0ABM0GIC7_SACKO|nr:PREDICTED: acetylcholinesterase-like [Saccoglossus kowalevskii]
MADVHILSFILLCCVAINFALSSNDVNDDDLLITLSGNSVIRGKRETVLDKVVDAYLGIPYGKAPIAELRFKAPLKVDDWDGVLDTTQYGNACYGWIDNYYGNFSGTQMWNSKQPLSEDCLNLNVWTTHPRPENAAVMVWIYGGGFYSGTSGLDVYNGKYLAAEEGVIVVSLNYRLGPLGFLYLHEHTPGNMGLLDQVLALQWVQDNIINFGGDPTRVTIFGESAGSVSVGMHLLSPLSRDLFNYAILESGTPNNPWASVSLELATDRASRLALAVGCYNGDFSIMLSCLRQVGPQELVNNQWEDYGVYVFPFVPVVDGTFLTETPQSSLDRHSFKNTSILIGSNLNEGNFFLIYGTSGFNAFTDSLLNHSLYQQATKESFQDYNQFGLDAISFQYIDWMDPDNDTMLRNAVDAMVGDYNIICPANQFATSYARVQQTVYKYYFTQVSSNSPWRDWLGSLHGDEIAYVFGIPLDISTGFSTQEIQLSRKIMKYWTNFAKTGNPNTGDEWPVYTPTSKEYLILNTDSLDDVKVGIGLRANKCGFWDYYLPNLNIQTADIEEAEKRWKEEFHQWSTKYMGDWKTEFQTYVTYKGQVCSAINDP